MLFPKHIRRKLSRLGREPAEPPAQEDASPQAPSAQPAPPPRGVLDDLSRKRLRSRLARRSGDPAPPAAPSAPEGSPVSLEAELPGDQFDAASGVAYRILRLPADWCDWGSHVEGRLANSAEPLAARLRGAGLDQIAFLDLETAGLSNAPLFLTGLLYQDGGVWRLEQILARTYPEEVALLARTAEALQQRPFLVTFNGRTFDLPFLADRLVYHRLPPIAPAGHLDLLPLARRRYKRRFGDCRLQTLERALLGRERTDDIPGEDIPAAYHDFVATGDARTLIRICRHNALDLLTLADLLPHLL